jgi:hypothetical protein
MLRVPRSGTCVALPFSSVCTTAERAIMKHESGGRDRRHVPAPAAGQRSEGKERDDRGERDGRGEHDERRERDGRGGRDDRGERDERDERRHGRPDYGSQEQRGAAESDTTTAPVSGAAMSGTGAPVRSRSHSGTTTTPGAGPNPNPIIGPDGGES